MQLQIKRKWECRIGIGSVKRQNELEKGFTTDIYTPTNCWSFIGGSLYQRLIKQGLRSLDSRERADDETQQF